MVKSDAQPVSLTCFAMYTGFYIFLGLLSLSLTLNITTNMIDGIPDHLHIPTTPFERIGEGFYYINTKNKVNWFAAAQECADLDAELVKFETLDEFDIVNHYLNDSDIHSMFWTSATNLANEKLYVWADGKPIDLDIWYPGEPNNFNGTENCAEVGHDVFPPKAFGLNDINCSSERFYICKARHPKTVSVVVW